MVPYNFIDRMIILWFTLFYYVYASAPSTEGSFKDQFCTDPRTMKKHAAYSEWADAYSCTRHRCQPGGRNLAIYTVGCKRVEAPESAIECEEVVEDTNMQFPYCCTRLRCLVVVRGEVWTRVLGQPWETLPAAPWSHMYKMKKPPPGDTSFLPKTPDEGPVYELQTDTEGGDNKEKVLRSGKTTPSPNQDCNDVKPRSVPAPDIVIALSTGNEGKDHNKKAQSEPERPSFSPPRHKRGRKTSQLRSNFEDDAALEPVQVDDQDESTSDRPQPEPFIPEVRSQPQPLEPQSEEKYYANAYGVTQRVPSSKHQSQVAWTEIPQNQWNEHEPNLEPEAGPKILSLQDPIGSYRSQDPPMEASEKKEEKPGNLQALVDAIGTRMRDIETVVQRMSEKVHQAKTSREPDAGSGERRTQPAENETHKHHEGKERKPKKANPDNDHYKRFAVRTRGSKYLHGASDVTTDQPLFVEDNNLNGYFSDASNIVRRAPKNPPEPSMTYMAPVETRRKGHPAENSEEADKKKKKHNHKKKHAKSIRRGLQIVVNSDGEEDKKSKPSQGHHKRHHGKETDKRKRFNKVNSNEVERNIVSLEDASSAMQAK